MLQIAEEISLPLMLLICLNTKCNWVISKKNDRVALVEIVTLKGAAVCKLQNLCETPNDLLKKGFNSEDTQTNCFSMLVLVHGL